MRWGYIVVLVCLVVLVNACALQRQSGAEWKKLAVPSDVETGKLGLSDVAVGHGKLVLSFWGGQKLAVLALLNGETGAETDYRYVNIESPGEAWKNRLGGAVAIADSERLYVSVAAAVYQVSLPDLEVEKVTDLVAPLSLERLAYSVSERLYGVWPFLASEKLTVWEIGKDIESKRIELEMPADFAKTTWVAGIMAEEQDLYVLVLNNYRLWLMKYAPDERRLKYAKRIALYLGEVYWGMHAHVWRAASGELLVYCGDKVYEVHEERMHLQRTMDYVDVMLNDDRLKNAFVAYDSGSSSLYVFTEKNGDAGRAFVRVLELDT